jgi:hypothetical protein
MARRSLGMLSAWPGRTAAQKVVGVAVVICPAAGQRGGLVVCVRVSKQAWRTAAQDRRDTYSGLSRVGRGPMPVPSSALGVYLCKKRTNAFKIAGSSLREEGVKMSWNAPGWIPGAPIKDATPPCACCGHRADSHLNPGSCSVRGRWWRRCRCSGYIALDWTTPQAAGPNSPHYDSFVASQPTQREPAPERQEDEQPPQGKHSVLIVGRGLKVAPTWLMVSI